MKNKTQGFSFVTQFTKLFAQAFPGSHIPRGPGRYRMSLLLISKGRRLKQYSVKNKNQMSISSIHEITSQITFSRIEMHGSLGLHVRKINAPQHSSCSIWGIFEGTTSVLVSSLRMLQMGPMITIMVLFHFY